MADDYADELPQNLRHPSEVDQALRDSEERLLAILNATIDAIITIDYRGIIENVNQAVERMFGFSHTELVGQNVKILMPAPFHDEHDGYIARFLKSGEAQIIGIGREMTGRRKDGSRFPVDLAVSHVERLKLVTGVLRDLSERDASQCSCAVNRPFSIKFATRLSHTDGNLTQTAKRLGITRNTLRSKMQQLGLSINHVVNDD